MSQEYWQQRDRWLRWESLDYPHEQLPSGADHALVAGVDLALLDGDIAVAFHQHFAEAGVDATHRPVVKSAMHDLQRALPLLEGHARLYFGEALAILADIDAALDDG